MTFDIIMILRAICNKFNAFSHSGLHGRNFPSCNPISYQQEGAFYYRVGLFSTEELRLSYFFFFSTKEVIVKLIQQSGPRVRGYRHFSSLIRVGLRDAVHCVIFLSFMCCHYAAQWLHHLCCYEIKEGKEKSGDIK